MIIKFLKQKINKTLRRCFGLETKQSIQEHKLYITELNRKIKKLRKEYAFMKKQHEDYSMNDELEMAAHIFDEMEYISNEIYFTMEFRRLSK